VPRQKNLLAGSNHRTFDYIKRTTTVRRRLILNRGWMNPASHRAQLRGRMRSSGKIAVVL